MTTSYGRSGIDATQNRLVVLDVRRGGPVMVLIYIAVAASVFFRFIHVFT